jgi:hypothetical protein
MNFENVSAISKESDCFIQELKSRAMRLKYDITSIENTYNFLGKELEGDALEQYKELIQELESIETDIMLLEDSKILDEENEI